MSTTPAISEQNDLTSNFYPFMTLEDWPQLGEWPQFDTLSTVPEFHSGPPSIVIKSSDESHSCPRESYEIFRNLICPAPSLHAPESNSVTVSAQLDEVLRFNQNAIDRLTKVLKCPCAISGHRAMVHASIVSRILIWYQQAAGWPVSVSSRQQQPTQTSASSSKKASSPLVQATGFSVEPSPVLIGTFSIEDQMVQAAFRNRLVLSELKKTGELIDTFFTQDLDEPSPTAIAGLYMHLGAWLRSEYSRTVAVIKSELAALEKDLES